MMLQQFINDIRNMSTRVANSVKSSVYIEGQSLLSDFKARSPVDKDIFRSSWRLSHQSSSSNIASIGIVNRTPYGGYLDEGAEKGGAPWYFPKKDESVSKSGKLRLYNGRVWAGGRSPSGFVGDNVDGQLVGITDSIFYMNTKRQIKIARRIADNIIGVI